MVNDTEPVLTEVWRGDYLESTHRGSVVVTGPDRRVPLAMGDVTSPMLPRSALKPFQAVAMLRAAGYLKIALVGLEAASLGATPETGPGTTSGADLGATGGATGGSTAGATGRATGGAAPALRP